MLNLAHASLVDALRELVARAQLGGFAQNHPAIDSGVGFLRDNLSGEAMSVVN